ncbi:EscU/YscU/HrcU family type III secretion system export apparatus switch protein [Oceanobacter mangrovi]|uniref:EscU/YscU/HrcU family type III secretion system export apparatus switch protein n=1 Tax=Oceanobacter mangrovi TaxID=2862510 RepID=UPI001C8E6587|nr:EscU/YscU/HrcU family type III secretion system export apparatus switch protein [Oceanobacter mangrovi]
MSIPESLKQSTQAVALKYRPEQQQTAPKLVAKGEEELAQAIIELALAHEVPIYENASLTQWLGQLDVGEDIPEALYQVIAEILAVVYQLQGKQPTC